jgi:hypothetical protein
MMCRQTEMDMLKVKCGRACTGRGWLYPKPVKHFNLPHPAEAERAGHSFGFPLFRTRMKFLIESSSPAQIFALRALIHSQPGWEVVGSPVNLRDALALTRVTGPDVIILDLDGETLVGDLLCSIQAAVEGSALVILGTDPELRRQVDSARVGHFFNKAYSPESLLEVLGGFETIKGNPGSSGMRMA